MTTRALMALLLALLALAGCGQTTETREPDVVISGDGPTTAPEQDEEDDSGVEIAVVTHGEASDPFWQIVRNGVEAAARDERVAAPYRSPDSFSVERMRRLINDAVDSRPDALVVSIPNSDVIPAVRRAVLAGIPVVSINTGSDVFRRVGAIAHIGQPEEEAGYQAGKRLAAAGGTRSLCVNQEVGNVGLDLRCRGFARAMREAGGSSNVVAIDAEQRNASQRRLSDAVTQRRANGVLTLSSTGAEIAVQALRLRPGFRMATFDLSPEVLSAVERGRLEFAVDQQPYLQGYLSVLFLSQRIRMKLFPADGEVFPTGPRFVTRKDAAQVERLSRRGVR